MGRVRIPKQVPIVPQDTFIAFDFLYQWAADTERLLGLQLGLTLKSNKSQVSSATLTADPDFGVLLKPLQKIRFRVTLAVSANFKFRLVGPAAPTFVSCAYQIFDATPAVVQSYLTAYSASDIVPAAAAQITLEGIVHNGTTAGIFGLDWAQNVSDPIATVIYAGSNFQYSSVDD